MQDSMHVVGQYVVHFLPQQGYSYPKEVQVYLDGEVVYEFKDKNNKHRSGYVLSKGISWAHKAALKNEQATNL